MVFEKFINDNLSEQTDVKNQLKDFLDAKVVEDVKKKELEPLSKAITENVDFDEKLESDMNVEHVTKLLEAMRDNLKPAVDTPEARKQAYKDAYAKRGKAYTFGVQSALKLMGFDLGEKQIDGEIGGSHSKTRTAIEQFQDWQKIDVDGAAGYDTVSKILEVGITTKAPAEVITKAPELKKKAPIIEKNPDFYTTHTEFTEEEFGGVKNKVYKVEKFSDIPTTIAKDTVIDFGSYYMFSNGKVYDYGANGDLVRRGDRSELDENGKWKEQIPTTSPEKPQAPVQTPEKPKARTQEVNEDIYKICETNLNEVLNPLNKDTKTGILSRLTPEQKVWFDTHIVGSYKDSMTSFTIQKNNPSFTVSMRDRAENSSLIQLGTIPFESYYKDNKFNKEGIYDRMVTLIQGRINAEKQLQDKLAKEKKDQETKQNVEKLLNQFRGSTFTLQELFPDKVGDISYEGYFNKFDDKKLEIWGSKYTKVIAENLNDITKTKVQFDLDDDGDDEKYNINKTVMLGDLLVNGAYSRAKAIEVLKPIVKDIVEKNFTV